MHIELNVIEKKIEVTKIMLGRMTGIIPIENFQSVCVDALMLRHGHMRCNFFRSVLTLLQETREQHCTGKLPGQQFADTLKQRPVDEVSIAPVGCNKGWENSFIHTLTNSSAQAENMLCASVCAYAHCTYFLHSHECGVQKYLIVSFVVCAVFPSSHICGPMHKQCALRDTAVWYYGPWHNSHEPLCPL